ncbi:hypothetical protein M9H77_23437 [Catharanthus roseus]|uniref:Uncharacterized protein n=1 Tax=Catharanthus roseus TaxID=4058 RepID=A0ACC0AU99_CATRO|nr:hypothetical protein M9H77_23437 [Catharanthus roseus]
MNFVFQLILFDHYFSLHQDSTDSRSAYIKGDQPRDGESGISICNRQGRAYSKTTTRYLDDKEYKAFRFHTKERGSGSLTYNCGVQVKGDYHEILNEII